jgi:phosphate transport system permease protein
MAIALIISPAILVSVRMLTEGENSQTIAANIALNFPIATTLQREALIGTGLLLFVISLAVNMLARVIASRAGKGNTKKTKKIAAQLPPSDPSTVLAVDDVLAQKHAEERSLSAEADESDAADRGDSEISKEEQKGNDA